VAASGSEQPGWFQSRMLQALGLENHPSHDRKMRDRAALLT